MNRAKANQTSANQIPMNRVSVAGNEFSDAKHADPSGRPGIAGAGIGLDLRASFLFMALLILVVFLDDPGQHTFALIFVSIVLEALPFMLLGALVSGFVEVFLSKDRLAEWLPERKGVLTFIAAGLGVIFPVCECAIVPVVRRFLRKGVPLSAAVAYLLAGPIFNPVVGASTFVAYASSEGLQPLWITVIRLGSGFGIAFVVGLAVGRLFPGSSALKAGTDEAVSRGAACGHDQDGIEVDGNTRRAKAAFAARCREAIRHGADDFIDVTQYLVMGAYIAGLLQTLVSRQAFLDLAGTPIVALPLMMGLAFVLNLCSEADAFLAASFRNVLPISAQMAFMVLGPMLDLKLVLMYLSVFRKRFIVVLALLIVLAVIGAMLLLQSLLGPWYGAIPVSGRMGPGVRIPMQ